jgi:hypothetical protein
MARYVLFRHRMLWQPAHENPWCFFGIADKLNIHACHSHSLYTHTFRPEEVEQVTPITRAQYLRKLDLWLIISKECYYWYIQHPALSPLSTGAVSALGAKGQGVGQPTYQACIFRTARRYRKDGDLCPAELFPIWGRSLVDLRKRVIADNLATGRTKQQLHAALIASGMPTTGPTDFTHWHAATNDPTCPPTSAAYIDSTGPS